ncbi:MAG: hypothetical protein JW981_00005, partial [Anaerolineae bacterium]|nr:hypothetical protein [Anaerolineae bacterium]
SEGVALNTWSNDTEFYIRVRGRYGAYSLEQPFRLEVEMQTSGCDAVSDDLPATSLVPTYEGYNTVILVDFDRMEGTAVDKETLLARLAALADRPEVNGVIVDVGQDARVAAANEQADAYPACPYAKNLVADAIKSIVDSYRVENPLEYVVIVGNDDVIPFFRHPDQALLASEKNYAPPVRDNTASQASLKLGYVLSQDRYGAQTEISYMADRLPVPDLAVGRLVETPADVITLLEAYLSTEGGVVPTPSSALVTGYDFLEDAAEAVLAELEAGLGTTADTLIAPREMSPADPDAWTADDLRALITQNRYDLAYLAGHFSASRALAADYATRLFSTDIVSSTVDMTNAILFSAGCHSGYNIVNEHGVTNVTREPDWAQAFARKGITLIAGTGYQYGDTDLIKYSERLYLEFSRELRYGSGPVAVGQALVNAKQTYLDTTPELRGIHAKALLEATLFGLPMLQVELPRGRDRQPAMLSDSSIVFELQPFTSDPGLTLGLEFADITATLQLTQSTKTLHVLGTTDEVITATYLSGKDGMTLNPLEPALPVAFYNVTAPRSDTVLRGVGFRGGLYHELPDVLPLTGAPATEVRGIHPPFYTDVFYPLQPWRINYFDALRRGSEGITRLVLSPAQYMSGSAGEITGILRVFDEMQFRLYYSGNFKTYEAGSTPAQSAPPYIANVAANYIKNSLVFRVRVNGNPAAGIQEVWVTYSKPDGFWRSLDLVQDRELSTLWWGVLPVGSSVITDMRYMVQAVNGVGLVAIDTKQGAYYTPGDNPGSEPSPTSYDTELVFQSPPTTGTYGSLLTFKVRLTRSSDNAPLADKLLTFGLGSLRRRVRTDSYGMASVTLPLQVLPGEQEVRVSFAGSGDALLAKAVTPLTVLKQATSISLVSGNDEEMLVATLTDVDGRPLKEMPLLFVIGDAAYQVLEATDYAGRAALGPVSLPDGAYPVRVTFGSAVLLGDGEVIDLRDDRYMSSSQSRILNLGSHSMYLPVIMRE